MSLSPWDLSGISFDFNLFRPRRASYQYATGKRRSSYFNATRRSESSSSDVDNIEGMLERRARKNSYKKATRGSTSDFDTESQDVFPPPPPPLACVHNGGNTLQVESKALHNLGNTGIRIEVTPPKNGINSTRNLNHSSTIVSQEISSLNDDDLTDYMNSMHEPVTHIKNNGECVSYTEPHFDEKVSNAKAAWIYRKNLVVICIGFILVFSAFRAIQNLQSSLNTEAALGMITMSTVHGTMIITSLCMPLVLLRFTSKWTIVVGIFFILIWVATNLLPHFVTLIPASLLAGIGQSLVWSGQVSYITKLAVQYARTTKEITTYEVYRFNGIFLGCFQTTHIWGNLVASIILSELPNKDLTSTQYCGVFDTCNHARMPAFLNNTTKVVGLAAPPVIKLMVTFAIFTACGLAVVALFLSSVDSPSEPEKSLCEITKSHVKHMFGHEVFRLLIPLLIFNGFEQGFVYADFTKSFITCKLGVKYVGYCMITMGVANCVSSIAVGIISRHIQREAILAVGGITHIALMVLLIMWMPDTELIPVFFIISALWGMCDAIWQTQCNTLIAISCPSDHGIAFSNFRLLQGLGATLAFILSSFLCVAVKLYIIIALLTTAILCYVIAEYHLKHDQPSRTHSRTSDQSEQPA